METKTSPRLDSSDELPEFKEGGSPRPRKPGTEYVRKRKVLYLSGYDPRGGGYYHRLYKAEAEKESKRSAEPIRVSKRTRNGRFSATWSVECQGTRTEYEFFSWDDIVRKCWLKTPMEILRRAFGIYAHYFLTGTAKKIRQHARIHFFTLIYPLLFISLLLLVSAGVAVGLAVLVGRLGTAGYLLWPASPVVAYFIYVKFGNFLEQRFSFYWVLRTYAFFIALTNNRADGLAERIDSYAEYLLSILRRDDYDEILLVGHSVGSILLPMVVSRALERDPTLAGKCDQVALLTLGHCIQDATLLPEADSVRAAIRDTAASGLFWLDVTAPPDGACYPLVDVAAGSNLDESDDPKSRISISARFHTMLTAENYRALKKDRLRLHFQYLHAGDMDSKYNYFKITAGSKTLHHRFQETN